MNPVRVGVVGVGHLGTLHTKMFSKIEGAALAAVYDIDQKKAAEVAASLHIHACRSLQELIDQCDAISIATSTKSHYEVACEALKHDKHIFLEKPITETVPQARKLNQLARENNILIQVGHIERFNPAIMALEKFHLNPLFIESHRLAQFNPRGTDVPVVLDLMIHDIDIILSLVKSDVEQVDASGVAVISDSADIANARLKFKNGCVANVTASRISQKKMRKMRLFQENAYISIDFASAHAEIFYLADPNDTSVTPTMMLGSIDKGAVRRSIVYEKAQMKEINPLEHELKLFVDSVRTGTPPAVSGEDGQRALEVAEVILQQIERGKEI